MTADQALVDIEVICAADVEEADGAVREENGWVGSRSFRQMRYYGSEICSGRRCVVGREIVHDIGLTGDTSQRAK